MRLADLPDDAQIRVLAIDPPLDQAAVHDLLAAIAKLFAQFAREDRLTVWAGETQAEGALLVLAWTAQPLSGCSHDKLNGLLTHVSGRDGRRMLDAPPIVVRSRDGVRCVDRAGLRALIAAGAVDGASPLWLRAAITLGQWRREAGQPLSASPLAFLVQGAPSDSR